jgi:hypothetical protein
LFDKEFEYLLLYEYRSVTGNFDRVFAGKGMGCTEKRYQHLVHQLISAYDVPESDGIGFLGKQTLAGFHGGIYGMHRLNGIGTGYTDNGYTACSGGGRYGTYGVLMDGTHSYWIRCFDV